ncbi:MAG: hypothetical protein ACO4BW_01190 [Nitriliruptoraceae bacterium]
MSAEDDARSDRRTLVVGAVLMLALILVGIGFGLGPAGTACRALDPDPIAADATARTRVPLADLGPAGDATVLAPRLAPHPDGALVLGGGVALVGPDGAVLAGAGFDPPVAVVGGGTAPFAVVVGNAVTGQVDALRPLLVGPAGVEPGACVDTSAVGSPLAFLLAAGDGELLVLRTDEDGSEAVLELRDRLRGRVWAPPLAVGSAPAGLLGARTSGGLGPDLAGGARRLTGAGDDDPAGGAVGRRAGEVRWVLTPDEVRAALPAAVAALPALRLEVAAVTADGAVLLVGPDTGPDDVLPAPVHGPLAAPGAAPVPGPVATLRLGPDGAVLGAEVGAPPVAGRDLSDGPGGPWRLTADAVVLPGGAP